MRDLAERMGKTPKRRGLQAAGGPCGSTYQSRFGRWSAALEEAGLELKPRGRRYERDELLEILRDVAEEPGDAPSMAELRAGDGLPSPSTYQRRFGSWNAALREAGLTARDTVKSTEDTGVWCRQAYDVERSEVVESAESDGSDLP